MCYKDLRTDTLIHGLGPFTWLIVKLGLAWLEMCFDELVGVLARCRIADMRGPIVQLINCEKVLSFSD